MLSLRVMLEGVTVVSDAIDVAEIAREGLLPSLGRRCLGGAMLGAMLLDGESVDVNDPPVET